MANNNRDQYNQDWDQNSRRYDQEGDYNQNNDYDQNRNRRTDYGNSGNFGGASYGNQFGQQDWNQEEYRNRGAGNYNTQRNQGSYNNEYGSTYGTGNYTGQRGRNQSGSIYGGDTRNYGNANQGGMNRDWWDRTRDEVSSWFGNDDAERRRDADRRTMGAHKGKGPKGYTRSDERIREDVHDRLSDDPYVDASDIEVKVENCEVILTGNVSDRDQKRRSEDIVEAISGVRNVENRLRVRQEQHQYSDARHRQDSDNRGHSDKDYTGYTGTTSDMSGIGSESGTTNEIIRNTGNMNKNR